MSETRSELYYREELQRAWPVWQDEVQPRNLVHLQVPCTVDQLLETLFCYNTSFQKRAQEARKYTETQTSPWTDVLSRLPGFPTSFSWTDFQEQQDTSIPSTGATRKVLFTCPGNALHPSAFRTEQVERCVSYEPNKHFTVEVCVLSSPIYCDRFRPIVKYSAVNNSSESCCLSIDYQIIYIAKVNFVLKRFIEGSARGGIEESFQKWLEALKVHFPSGIVDLKTSIDNIQPTPQRKELKSHRLEDLSTELEDDLKMESITDGSSALTALTMVLLLMRCFLELIALGQRLFNLVAYIPRKLISSGVLPVALNMVFTATLAFFTYLILMQQLLTYMEVPQSDCCLGSAILCFTISIATGLLTQYGLSLKLTI